MLHKTVVFIWTLFLLSSINSVNADRVFRAEDLSCPHTHTCKKYTLSVCAIFNNEARRLPQWIEHHRLQGVDHFYLYNAGSKDDYHAILIPYINQGLVTLVNWPNSQDDADEYSWALGTQVPAFENAVNFLSREETKWLLLADVDEFLECPKGNLKELLIEYDDFPGIVLSSTIADEAGEENSDIKRSIAYKSASSNSGPLKPVKKMIFKPDHCSGFTWPPYACRFNTEQAAIEAGQQELYILQKNTVRKRSPLSNHTPKYDATHSSVTSKQGNKSFKHKYEDEFRDNPMYLYMPEFLKKMKRMQIEGGN